MLQLLAWVLAGVCFGGTLLNIYKKRACFVVWGIANIGFIAINIYLGIWGQAFMFISQLGFSIFGYIKWSKK